MLQEQCYSECEEKSCAMIQNSTIEQLYWSFASVPAINFVSKPVWVIKIASYIGNFDNKEGKTHYYDTHVENGDIKNCVWNSVQCILWYTTTSIIRYLPVNISTLNPLHIPTIKNLSLTMMGQLQRRADYYYSQLVIFHRISFTHVQMSHFCLPVFQSTT